MTPASCESWFLNAAIISRVYLAIHLFQNAFAGPWKIHCAGGIVALAESLLGTSIASGKLVPFAAGLVFLDTLVSKISAYHLHFPRFVPDPWAMIVVFATPAILMCSTWIAKLTERLRSTHLFELFSKNEGATEVKLLDENVEITIRIDDRGFDILRKCRCVVTVHLPKEGPHSARQVVRNNSESGEARRTEQDHKLPFWVK